MRTAIKLLAMLLFFGAWAALMAAQTVHNAALSWTASSDAAANPGLGYNVYRLNAACPASGTTGFTKINSSPVTAIAYTDTPLALGSYCWYVTATLNGAESGPSDLAGGTVTPATVTLKVTVQ